MSRAASSLLALVAALGLVLAGAGGGTEATRPQAGRRPPSRRTAPEPRRLLGRLRPGVPLGRSTGRSRGGRRPVSGASGSGFLIEGGRILTNGHVIADARQILVRRPDQANPYVATRRGGGRRLRPRRAARRRPRVPARACSRCASATLPEHRRAASSPTASRSGARTSRRPRASSRASSRAATCTPAPTRTSWCRRTPRSTPATAAGPSCRTGSSSGVAFQGFPGAENMGFFIPIPIVRHFLANLEDGRYDGFPDSGLDDDAAHLARVPARARPAEGPRRRRGRPRGPGRDLRRRR